MPVSAWVSAWGVFAVVPMSGAEKEDLWLDHQASTTSTASGSRSHQTRSLLKTSTSPPPTSNALCTCMSRREDWPRVAQAGC
eukprot:1998315-Rhodomonas_salina.3